MPKKKLKPPFYIQLDKIIILQLLNKKQADIFLKGLEVLKKQAIREGL